MYIHWGPDTWTENRTDDEVRTIDVLIKVWNSYEDVPKKVRHTHLWSEDDASTSTGTTAIEVPDLEATGTVEKTFTWTVPENLRTTATYHNHVHPHDVENDQAYLAVSDQWVELILAGAEYETAITEAREELGAL